MKASIFNLLLGMAALSLLVACNGDDPDPSKSSEPLFTAKINGVPFTGDKLSTVATLEWETSNSFEFALASSNSFDISLGKGRLISLGLIGDDFDKIKPGTEVNGLSLLTGLGVIGFFHDYQTPDDYATGISFTGENSIYLKITDIDKSSQVISGEFWFNAKADDGTLHEITEGVFRNIKYTIEE